MWCSCTCRADALERVKFDRELLDACSRYGHPVDEQCDCDLRVRALGLRPSASNR